MRLPRAAALALLLLPAAAPAAARLTGLQVEPRPGGLRLVFRASGPLEAGLERLRSPERVVVKFKGASLAGSPLPRQRELGPGPALRLRLGQHAPDEVWAVVDLAGPLDPSLTRLSAASVELSLGPPAGGAYAPPAPSPSPSPSPLPTRAPSPAPEAEPEPALPPRPAAAQRPRGLPQVACMFFDLDVAYEGKRYARFPCANFIYNPSEAFPLQREFVSALVFSAGEGDFQASARVLDPQGRALSQTLRPFPVRLYNRRSEAMVELPWKLLFADKGTYRLAVDLDGTRVLSQPFYVGHSSDPAD